MIFVLLSRPRLRWLGFFVVGVLWALLHQYVVMMHHLPKQAVTLEVDVEGVIDSIPQVRSLNNQTQTQVELVTTQIDHHAMSTRLLLSCYKTCPIFYPGEVWQMRVRLQSPQNLGNPGGFDRVMSLRARHIFKEGVARSGSFKRVSLGSERLGSRLFRLRQRLALQLNALNTDLSTLGPLQALTLGISSRIDETTWGLFRRTGTTHLMVISGAHIGLVAGLGYAFFKWFWCRFRWGVRRIPAQRVASLGGFFIATGYALLAGMGVPAQRALMVCFFMCLRYFLPYKLTVWQAWRYALGLVILCEPHATLLPGFYLSFLAVAILIAVSERVTITGIKKTLCLQAACLLGLMPLTLFWFSYGSINGFLANLVAIPWVSFVIIPLGLIITVLSSWIPMTWMMAVVKCAMHMLLLFLQWIDSWSMLNLTFTLTSVFAVFSVMLAMMGLMYMVDGRWFFVLMVMLCCGLFFKSDDIHQGHARVDVLDVGQGLAVVVRTAHHVLVYDTGMQFRGGKNMGDLAVIPYLKAQGIKKVDTVVISHPDLDHRGGLDSLDKAYPIRELFVDNPAFYQQRFHRTALPCHDTAPWNWDGVSFRFFAIHSDVQSKNNRSCVLHVSNASGSVLLTGDIERPAERYLVKHYPDELVSSVLVVPHHGSKTSSSEMFLQHVAPQYAVMSYGFHNRYHFPHRPVMARYRRHHIPVVSTNKCGLVRIRLKDKKNSPEVTCTRYHKIR